MSEDKILHDLLRYVCATSLAVKSHASATPEMISWLYTALCSTHGANACVGPGLIFWYA